MTRRTNPPSRPRCETMAIERDGFRIGAPNKGGPFVGFRPRYEGMGDLAAAALFPVGRLDAILWRNLEDRVAYR